MLLPRPIENLTIIGLGASVYDWIAQIYQDMGDVGEVWTINAGGVCFRCDVLWDMHSDEWIEQLQPIMRKRVIKRREWLKNYDKPVVMPKAKPEYPTSVTYPLREVIEKTSSVYFGTGMAYMLAMALACEVKRLRMFGCDFSYDRQSNTHDEQGRACCEYWVGRLVGSGCQVGTSTRTHFLDGWNRSKGKIYGYHEPVVMEFPVDGGKGKFVAPDYL